MAITHEAFFVANRLAQSLAKCDADIFDCVVIINMDVAVANYFQVN